MAARGLLYHPLHARPPSCRANPPYRLPRRFYSFSDGFSTTSSGCRLSSSPSFRSVQCAALEAQAGKVEASVSSHAEQDSTNGETDLIEWVNKTAPGPMVEVDPVTVFRRIVAERAASLAMARAKQQAAGVDTIQSTTPPPFFLSRRWLGKSALPLVLALVFLAWAAVSYFRGSKSDSEKKTENASSDGTDEKETENALADGKDNADATDERCKLVKDTVKAPESILTAMAIGAASVGRPKGQTGSSHDTVHAANGNSVDIEWPDLGAVSNPVVDTAGITDTRTEWHQKSTFGHMSYNAIDETGHGTFKSVSARVDITEGPWFSQVSHDGGVFQLDSSIQSTPLVQRLEFESVPSQRQELQLPSEDAVQQLVEVCYETPFLNNVVDGEFLGEVVAVSVATEEAASANASHSKVESFKSEEPEEDGVFGDSNEIVEQLEQTIGEESVNMIEGTGVADEIADIELKQHVDSSLSEAASAQMNVTELTDAQATVASLDSDDAESSEQLEVLQLMNPLEVYNGASVVPSDEKRIDGSQTMAPLDPKQHGDIIEEPEKAVLTYEEPQTLIQAIEEPEAAIKAAEVQQMAILAVEKPQTGILSLKEPKIAIQSFEEPQTAIQSIEEPQNAIQPPEVLETANQVTEESLTDIRSFEKTQAAIQSFEEPQTVIQSFAEPQATIQVIEQPQMDIRTVEEPETAIQAIQDLQANGSQNIDSSSAENSGAIAAGLLANATLESSGEDSRVENMRALEAALPALAIGVGTMGTLFGVAGGLQVVGFAALARFLSQNVFWAKSREEFWEEVEGINDRQKLLDFLARRNILKKEVEESSL